MVHELEPKLIIGFHVSVLRHHSQTLFGNGFENVRNSDVDSRGNVAPMVN